MGSKNRIAAKIISILPSAESFVDLFGGGFAISHAALLSKKWKHVYYNEKDPLVASFVTRALEGTIDTRRFITRDEFNRLKGTHGFVKYLWSFGSNGRTYMYAKDREEYAYNLHNHYLKTGVKLSRIQHFERMNRVATLSRLKGLGYAPSGISMYDYKDFPFDSIDDSCAIYCDPPYEGCYGYGKHQRNDFVSKDFYTWVYDNPRPVFFSSYEISDNRFERVPVANVRSLLDSARKTMYKNEYLYFNKAAENLSTIL